jgi:hypothetical protein
MRVGRNPATLGLLEARRRNNPTRTATWVIAEMLWAEPYLVEVSTLEN